MHPQSSTPRRRAPTPLHLPPAPTMPLAPFPLWPQLDPIRQQHVAQLLADLIRRMYQQPIQQEGGHDQPTP